MWSAGWSLPDALQRFPYACGYVRRWYVGMCPLRLEPWCVAVSLLAGHRRLRAHVVISIGILNCQRLSSPLPTVAEAQRVAHLGFLVSKGVQEVQHHFECHRTHVLLVHRWSMDGSYTKFGRHSTVVEIVFGKEVAPATVVITLYSMIMVRVRYTWYARP